MKEGYYDALLKVEGWPDAIRVVVAGDVVALPGEGWSMGAFGEIGRAHV